MGKIPFVFLLVMVVLAPVVLAEQVAGLCEWTGSAYILPSESSGNAGEAIAYTLYLENTDNGDASCPSSRSFTIKYNGCPSGWTCALSTSVGSTTNTVVYSVDRGSIRQVGLIITPSDNAAPGTYDVGLGWNDDRQNSGTVSFHHVVQTAEQCSIGNSVSVEPSTASGSAGDSKDYAVEIINTDVGGSCPASKSYNLKVQGCPTDLGWTCQFATSTGWATNNVSQWNDKGATLVKILRITPSDSPLGLYSMRLGWDDGRGKSGSETIYYNLEEKTCDYSRDIQFEDSSKEGVRGEPVDYTLDIANSDSGNACGITNSYTLKIKDCPSGWTCWTRGYYGHENNGVSVALNTGSSAKTLLTIIPSEFANPGTYNMILFWKDDATLETGRLDFAYRVVESACGTKNPINTNSTYAFGGPSDSKDYKISFENTEDTRKCGSGQGKVDFKLGIENCPTGWSCLFKTGSGYEPNPIISFFGETFETILRITPGSGAAIGVHEMRLNWEMVRHGRSGSRLIRYDVTANSVESSDNGTSGLANTAAGTAGSVTSGGTDVLIKAPCNGCESGGLCYPVGYRQEGQYCSADTSFHAQSLGGIVCDNSFECDSNVCAGGKCVGTGLIERILAWLANFFGMTGSLVKGAFPSWRS